MARRLLTLASVASATYRQRSDHDPAGFAADPENRLLRRKNRDRLDFEAARDAMLATILHLLGFDHETFTYRYAGRDFRLTDATAASCERSWRERPRHAAPALCPLTPTSPNTCLDK